MSLLEDELERLIEKKIVVVMSDGRKFLGKLIKYDSKIIVLEDILELSDRFQWVKPVIYTTIGKSGPETQDIVERAERGYLNEVLINNRNIIRIWPWQPMKMEK